MVITEGNNLGRAHASAADPAGHESVDEEKGLLGAQDPPKSALRSPQDAPRSIQKSIKLSINFRCRFWIDFGSFWGPQLGVIFDQISSQNRLGAV